MAKELRRKKREADKFASQKKRQKRRFRMQKVEEERARRRSRMEDNLHSVQTQNTQRLMDLYARALLLNGYRYPPERNWGWGQGYDFSKKVNWLREGF
jgi:predicted Zn-dependent peptidase